MRHDLKLPNLMTTTSVIGLSIAMWAGATAAGAAAAAPATDASEVQQVVVTGSRIPRAGFDTLQPAQTVTSETIADRGFTNVADSLNELSAFGTPGSNNTGQQSGANVGQQFVNLYGLGAQRTLTLVNGRRFVSSSAATVPGPFGGAPAGQEVDLNDIPAGLVDHVEVLTVGGAPTYGADAIAGTVNVILKDNYQGLTVESQYGIANRGDGASYAGRLLAGGNFADDRGNVTLSVEYTKQDGLTYADRKHVLPYDTFAPSASCTAAGYGRCLVENATVPSLSPNGIPVLTGGLPQYGDGIKNSAGQIVAFAPNGTLQPYNFGVLNDGPVFAQGGDGYDLSSASSFVAPLTRTLVDGFAHYDLTPHVRAYAEAYYAHNEGRQTAAQPTYQSTFFPTFGSGPVELSINNPFLTPQAKAILQANGVTNTFFLQRANTDLAPQSATNLINVYRLVTGLKGDFEILDRKVNWDGSFNYGRSEATITAYDINNANFYNAVNAVRDPATGNIVCAVTLNPPAAPPYGQPNSVTGCVPLNLFGNGAPSAAARNFVVARTITNSLITQRDLELNANTTLFNSWAGPVKGAIGFEFRQEGGSFTFDGFQLAGLGRGAPSNDVSGNYDSKEYYAEANVPLVAPKMEIPYVHSAEFDASYRRIENNLAGQNDVYTLGLKYSPVTDLEFRGNVTHSVRAPAIAEQFLPLTNTTSFANDPCDPNYINANPTRKANCTAAFAALGAPLNGFVSNVVNATANGTTGGNTHLLNEQANAWTAGIVLRPHQIPRLIIALDWVNIHLKDPITSLSLTQVMNSCYDAGSFPNTFCSLFTRDSKGQVVSFNTPLVNAGAQEFAGLQLDATYSIDVNALPLIEKVGLKRQGDLGGLAFDVNGFFEEKHNTQILGITTKTRGDIGDPEWRFNASVRYRKGPLMVYLNGRYISSGAADVMAQRSSQNIFGVGWYTVFNGAISYDLTKRITAQLSVSNLFNQDPPKYAATLSSTALSTYDYFGQAYVFKLKANF